VVFRIEGVNNEFSACFICGRVELGQSAHRSYFCKETDIVTRNLLQNITDFKLVHMLPFVEAEMKLDISHLLLSKVTDRILVF
jgi:hypothetical protein